MVIKNEQYTSDCIKDFGEVTGIINNYLLNKDYQKKWYFWYKYSLNRKKATAAA